ASRRVGHARREPQPFAPVRYADRAWSCDEARGEFQHGETQERVQEHREYDDHEERAPVAKLVAQLANPDETNNGPAHGVAVLPGRRRLQPPKYSERKEGGRRPDL